MTSTLSQNQLEKTLTKAESVLNLLGYIPLISTFSAGARSLGGMLQAVLGCLYGLICLAMGRHSRKNFAQALHGLFNIVRAKFEAIPFLSLVTCLPYDLFLKWRFRYAAETFQEKETFLEEDVIEI